MEWTCCECEKQVDERWFDTEERMCDDCMNEKYCDHKEKVYQRAEPENNVPEDYSCKECGKQFDLPEPPWL